MRYLFFILIFFSLGFSTNPRISLASEIYFEKPKDVEVGNTFILPIYLGTDKISINTVDLEIYFNNDLLDFSGYVESDFFIKNWIEIPKVENNKIAFSFIIPGGINGIYDIEQNGLNDIPLINLKFKAKASGNSSFIFIKNIVLKNDGLGSNLELVKKDLNIEILSNSKAIDNTKDINHDLKSPLSFVLEFIPKSNEGNTDNMIVFNAIDEESGIKEYRIKRWNEWILVSSPYILDNNIFSKTITIRAYDFENNYTESSIYIKGFIDFEIFIILILLLIFSSFFGYKLLK